MIRVCLTCLLSFLPIIFGCCFPADTTISRLKYLSEFVVAHNQEFRNTTIGGLSGIDYDIKRDLYYLLSDDRSSINSARYYTAKIILTDKGIDTVEFVDFNYFTQKDGSLYPDARKDPSKTIDFEAIRYNFRTDQFVVASEGERIVKKDRVVLADPMICLMDNRGKNFGEFILPEILRMNSALPLGPRQNGALEGLSFNAKASALFVALEEPLHQDSAPASLENTQCWTRIFYFNTRSRKNTKQIAYPLDPVAFPPSPSDAYKINGVSEILWVGEEQFIVIERSFSTGRPGCTIKVFLASSSAATDVSDIKALSQEDNVTPMTKKLLLNLDDLGIYIDNIEGVTFGPTLPNGHRTLILVSDNNFAVIEKTQFLLFEVIP